MASLDEITFVQIALQSTGIARGDFGTPMIVAPLMSFNERVRAYSSYKEAAEDGLPNSLLTALSDCFGQIPRPRIVKVGRRTAKYVIAVNNVAANSDYGITVNGVQYSYTSDATPTAGEIAVGLATAVNNDAGRAVTATAVGDTLEVVWNGTIGTLSVSTGLAIADIAPTETIANDLNAILGEDSDWYGLVLTERVQQTQIDAAEWTEANERLFITATNDPAVLNAAVDTDLVSQLKNRRYYRTAVLYHTNADTEYPDAAWAGRVFTVHPGSETWALKQLASVTPSALSSTNRQTVANKGGNTFEFYSQQIALTNPGKAAAGEWIDVIRFRDWLKNLIQTNMVQMMINRDKIPYTDAGIQLCVNNLRKSLQTGQDVGGIAPDEVDENGKSVPGFLISYPRSADISPNVKATRVLTLGFSARLAGAIHVAEISGSLSYEI